MKVGFIGAGNMARAIANGLHQSKTCARGELHCFSATGAGAKKMAAQTGAIVAASKTELIAASEVVVLAFKPQHLESITAEEAAACQGKIVISVLAGRTLASMHAIFGDQADNLIRVMPNTPSQIGKGVSTFCFHHAPSESQRSKTEAVLASLGTAHEVEEDQLHIATVINGCGPAFYFRLVQLISETAAKHGLDHALAAQLACETGIGSLELLNRSGKDPQTLIDEVVSPNGVTHALLTSLDRNGLPKLIEVSAQDAVNRSIELSKPS